MNNTGLEGSQMHTSIRHFTHRRIPERQVTTTGFLQALLEVNLLKFHCEADSLDGFVLHKRFPWHQDATHPLEAQWEEIVFNVDVIDSHCIM
jgi:hypothetical protein